MSWAWFWPEGFYTLVMIFVFAFGAFAFKLPIAVAMAFAAIVGAAVGGAGFPLRHIVEGEFGYLNTIMVICTAMIFMKVVQKTGLLDSLSAWVIRKFKNAPALLSIGIMIIIMLPGMITGSSTAAVLTTGALVSPVLMTLGLSKVRAAAVVSMGAILGMIAPPISIPAMIICAGVDIPYVGFAVPLMICTFPLAVVFALTMIYPGIRGSNRDEAALEKHLSEMERNSLTFRLFLPVVVLVVLFSAEQFLPTYVSLGMPVIFLASALSGLLSGTRWKVFETIIEAVDDALPVMGILMGVGMFIQIMTLIGVQGFIVVSALSLPSWTLFVGIAVTMPLFGAVSSFGSASVLGVPFLLALLNYNSVIVASALSLIASLGDLMPPTALAGIFAAQVVGEENYFRVLKLCLLPGVCVALWGIAVILMSPSIASILF
ncbi:MAG: TRAP transporter large permease subunit [Synergistaceae bacterium]|nr:TRAP transporter large permease subunit [Synergistaceae bacterium]